MESTVVYFTQQAIKTYNFIEYSSLHNTVFKYV